jgi:hypothetical protein
VLIFSREAVAAALLIVKRSSSPSNANVIMPSARVNALVSPTVNLPHTHERGREAAPHEHHGQRINPCSLCILYPLYYQRRLSSPATKIFFANASKSATQILNATSLIAALADFEFRIRVLAARPKSALCSLW